MPWVGLQFVIVVFPDHTHLFLNFVSAFFACSNNADIFSKSIPVKIRNFSVLVILILPKAPVTHSRFCLRFIPIRPDETYIVKSGCIGMAKTENSEIPTMSHDVPTKKQLRNS